MVLGECGDGKTRYIGGRKGTNVTGFVEVLGGAGTGNPSGCGGKSGDSDGFCGGGWESAEMGKPVTRVPGNPSHGGGFPYENERKRAPWMT